MARLSGVTAGLLVKFAKATILSLFRYAAATIILMDKTTRAKLQVLQNQTLKPTIGVPDHVRNDDIHNKLRILPVWEAAELETCSTVITAQATPWNPLHPTATALDNVNPRARWAAAAARAMNKLTNNVSPASAIREHRSPLDTSELHTSTTQLPDSKSNTNPEVAKQLALDQLMRFTGRAEIFTDGPVHQGKTGCAYWSPDFWGNYRLPARISILQAELTAIQCAAQECVTEPH